MIDWPEKLIHDIARRRCVAFLGAGVSRRAVSADGRRPPLWREFLDAAIAECDGPKSEINRLIKAKDFLSACQLVKTRLGLINWHDLLERKFLQPNYGPADIHQAIFNLDLPIVATTNIDTIYDKFLSANYNAAAIVKNYHDESIGRYIKSDSSTRVVVKVHGSVDHLDNTVFTREEYATSRNKYANFYDLLAALISTQTFMFLGYSLSDPDINLLLEDNSRRFRSQRPHYLITSDRVSDDLRRLYEDNYSIKLIKYSPASEHIELVESLNNLGGLAVEQRTEMAARLVW